MFQNWELEPTAVVVCLDLCCRQTRREGRVKINEQNWVLTSWQAAGLWQCSSHRLRIVGAGPTQWARPSPRLIIVISSGHALNPPSTTCPSNKCDGCFYLQPFNKPDLARQECFALQESSQEKYLWRPTRQGRRFHLLDNWGSNKKITPGPQFRNPAPLLCIEV